MKKHGWKIGLALLAIAFISIISSYQSLVKLSQARLKAWADVQGAYQRRADLIPNLVNVVKGYADFEKSTLTQVIEARAKATSITIQPDNLDAASMQQFREAQEGINSALSRLLVVVEQYPDLKANQNFLNLQEQLEGTENRIFYVREKFNGFTQDYNTKQARLFTSLWVKWFYPKFETLPYFEAQKGADIAPSVDFSD